MCAIGIAAPGFMSMLVKLIAADAVPVNRRDSDTPAADLTDLLGNACRRAPVVGGRLVQVIASFLSCDLAESY